LTENWCVRTHINAVNWHHGDFAERVLLAERIQESFVRLTGARPRAAATDTKLHDQTVPAGGLATAVVAQLRERGPSSNDAP
jgi:hypothetical protein